jgi:hypothetical protein
VCAERPSAPPGGTDGAPTGTAGYCSVRCVLARLRRVAFRDLVGKVTRASHRTFAGESRCAAMRSDSSDQAGMGRSAGLCAAVRLTTGRESHAEPVPRPLAFAQVSEGEPERGAPKGTPDLTGGWVVM